MSKGLCFWIIYLVLLIVLFIAPATRPYWIYTIAIFVLIGLVGWAVFGPIVH